MAILVRFGNDSSHWYTCDSFPFHTISGKNGNIRPVNVSDARKLNLLPSVTNVLNVLHKPQLEKYKITAAIKAAIASPKLAEESEDYYVKRIIDASKEDVRGAADLGTRIHEAIDLALDGTAIDPELSQYVLPVVDLVRERGWDLHDREQVLVNLSEGYAGRCDALFKCEASGEFGVVDFKTRRTKPDQRSTPYDGQAEQLAAYARAVWGKDAEQATLINVYISTTEPGRVEVYEHPQPLADYWRVFKAACTIWRATKNYDPRVR